MKDIFWFVIALLWLGFAFVILPFWILTRDLAKRKAAYVANREKDRLT